MRSRPIWFFLCAASKELFYDFISFFNQICFENIHLNLRRLKLVCLNRSEAYNLIFRFRQEFSAEFIEK